MKTGSNTNALAQNWHSQAALLFLNGTTVILPSINQFLYKCVSATCPPMRTLVFLLFSPPDRADKNL
jgi:hypothetical protein